MRTSGLRAKEPRPTEAVAGGVGLDGAYGLVCRVGGGEVGVCTSRAFGFRGTCGHIIARSL